MGDSGSVVEESSQPKTKVFVSYSRTDEAFARRLSADLEARGIEVFRDVDDTLPGEEWWARLRSLIAAADTIVFVLSSRSIASKVCRDEVDFADSLNKRIFPAVIEGVEWASVPAGLAARHSVFFKDEAQHSTSLDQLVAALLTDLDWVREHTRLLERAQAWEARGSHELLSGRGLEAAERWMAATPAMAETPTALHLAFIKASRDAATRRRQFLLAAMAAALLVSISLAAAALWQRSVAIEQQAIAEANEGQAKEERDRALLTQSRFLAQAATEAMGRGDAGTGMALALEALPDQRDGNDRPYSAEAEIALFNARLKLQEQAITAGSAWVAFSPDGRQIVTMWGGEIVILDAKSLDVVTRIAMPDLYPSAAFSPDGRRVLTLSKDGAARISDIGSGQELATLRGHRDYVSGGDFSPDGRRVVTSSLDGEGRIWDAETGEALLTLKGHTGFVSSAAFSPDGRNVVTASWDGTARIWNASTGKEIVAFPGEGRLAAVAYSADGGRVVTASLENNGRIWDVKTGKALHILAGHTDSVVHARFSRDGRRVITASYDRTAKIWDAESGQEIGVIAGHQGGVSAADFSPDGATAITVAADGTLRMWTMEPGAPLISVLRHEGMVEGAAFSPDSQRLVTSTGELAEVWNLGTATMIASMGGKRLRRTAFSADGRRVLALVDNEAGDTVGRIWNADTGETMFTLEHPFLKDAVFSPDGRRVATTSLDDTAQIWDAETGKIAIVLKGHHGTVEAAAFSPDGGRIATISGDNTLRIWNSETGVSLIEIPAKVNSLRILRQPYFGFTPDGQAVVIASYDSTVSIWNAVTGDPVRTMTDHKGILDGLSISPSGDRIVSLAQQDKTARLWDVATGKTVAVLEHAEDVFSAAFSRDGRRIVTASRDGTAKIWDSQTGRIFATLSGHQGLVTSAAFSPDGKHLVTSSTDQTARVWPAYESVQELVDEAKGSLPRCLTAEQRGNFFLDPQPPAWCRRAGKWPFGQGS
jgi:WD40 repeat protein